MADFFLDPAWGFLSFVLAIALFVYTRRRSQKVVRYETVSLTLAAGINKRLGERVELQYKSDGEGERQHLSRIFLLIVRITNSSTKPINASDYQTPLSIRLEGDFTILDAEIISEEKDKALLESADYADTSKLANWVLKAANFKIRRNITLKIDSWGSEKIILSQGRVDPKEYIELKILVGDPDGNSWRKAIVEGDIRDFNIEKGDELDKSLDKWQ